TEREVGERDDAVNTRSTGDALWTGCSGRAWGACDALWTGGALRANRPSNPRKPLSARNPLGTGSTVNAVYAVYTVRTVCAVRASSAYQPRGRLVPRDPSRSGTATNTKDDRENGDENDGTQGGHGHSSHRYTG